MIWLISCLEFDALTNIMTLFDKSIAHGKNTLRFYIYAFLKLNSNKDKGEILNDF